MSNVYLRGFMQREQAEDGPIRFVIATEGRKADGIDLRMDRLSLDRYRSNPVIMYGHDYYGRGSLPIGRAENVRVEKSALMADAVFDMDDEFAATVDRKYRGGFLNAVSVGFDFGRLDSTGVPESWELFEFSAVPIPLDPDAVMARARMLDLDAIKADPVALTDAQRAELAEIVAPALTVGKLRVDIEPETPAIEPGSPLAVYRHRLDLMALEAAL